MKHFKITFEPDNKQITIHSGASILEAAGQAGIVLNTICGGKGTCGKCEVILKENERQVPACQYKIESDLAVTIPQGSRYFEQKILDYGIDTKTDSSICTKYHKADVTGNIFGLAVDIGTTTVVGKLLDLKDGGTLATQAVINPQVKFGDDCLSRIAYAQTDEKLAELQKVIIDCLNEIIGQLCQQVSAVPDDIYEVSIVGNTTMNHIFLKLPVTQLGQAPYKAYNLDAKETLASDLGLNVNSIANVHTAENIAGFVGADTTIETS